MGFYYRGNSSTREMENVCDLQEELFVHTSLLAMMEEEYTQEGDHLAHLAFID